MSLSLPWDLSKTRGWREIDVMSGNIRLSVVIPTLNEAETIDRALRSVEAFDEVIVVDGNSEDATRELAQRRGVRVLSTNRGRGSQLRAGAAATTGDALLFLHADNWLEDGVYEQLTLLFEQRAGCPTFGCLRQRIDDARLRFRLLEQGNAFRATRLQMPYGDQAMFVDRDTYDQTGGFADVALMEDVIFSRRARVACRPIMLAGPVYLSARRWHRHGVLRQTLKNWFLFLAFRLGARPERLVEWYR